MKKILRNALYILLVFVFSSCLRETNKNTVFKVIEITTQDTLYSKYELRCQDKKAQNFYFRITITDTINKYKVNDILYLNKH